MSQQLSFKEATLEEYKKNIENAERALINSIPVIDEKKFAEMKAHFQLSGMSIHSDIRWLVENTQKILDFLPECQSRLKVMNGIIREGHMILKNGS